MNQLERVFNYEEKQVRTIIRDGQPWWVLKDVCDVLEIANSRDAGLKLDEDEKASVGITDTSSNGITQNRSVTIINESGLYNIILLSRKPEARKFKRWITHEVLPEIRRTGQYNQYKLPMNYTEALESLLEEVKKNEILQPKAEMYDVLISAENCQTIAEVAKAFGMGRNKLFGFLRDKGVLMWNNLPYQKYLDRDYFEVREVSTKKGDIFMNFAQTIVTAKGIDFIGKLLKKGHLQLIK